MNKLSAIEKLWKKNARIFILKMNQLMLSISYTAYNKFLQFYNWDFQYKCYQYMKFIKPSLAVCKKAIHECNFSEQTYESMIWYRRQGDVLHLFKNWKNYEKAMRSYAKSLQYTWLLQDDHKTTKDRKLIQIW